MKFLDETGLKFIATKYKELRDSLTNKVDKVTGKDLSTNDYTNEAKAKVDAIPADPKYTDTIQDLSGYAKKEELPYNILHVDNGDEILTYKTFAHKYLKKKIETDRSWGEEFFPRGAYIYRMPNSSDAPENTNDFVVFTAFNADIDCFGDVDKVYSKFIEQIVLSFYSGRIYTRYINLIEMLDENGVVSIEELEEKEIAYFGHPMGDVFIDTGVRGRWTKWKEITKDFAIKDDIIKALSDYAKKSELDKKADKTEIKTKLSEMSDDSTHRLVTDDEKTAWNGKIGIDSFRNFADVMKAYITDEFKKYKQQVILTQSQYDALSSTDKNDASKIYFIKA